MIFWIAYYILYFVIFIFAPFKIVGKKNIDKTKNYIIVCNHKSNFDSILIDMVFKKKVKFLAKIELFNNKFSAGFYKACGGIGFDRKKGLSLSQTKMVFDLIKTKNNVAIFPEGTRKEDLYDDDELKGGACFFAIKTKTPIIPVYIVKKHRFFKKNTVIVGQSFELNDLYDKALDKVAMTQADSVLKASLLDLKHSYESYLNEQKLVKKLAKDRQSK